ncbi:MAG: hypothetical protein ABI616_10310 [Pseudomonadota bacterium]
MARLLTLILIVANVLYFAWSHWAGGNKIELTAVPMSARAPKPKAPPGPPPCSTLGPFENEARAETAQRALEGGGWGVLRRSKTAQVNDGYWVHIDNLSSSLDQARVVNRILRAGIQDAFAMPDDAQHRVSVGIFKDEDRAEDRATRVQRLKLDAVVTERFKDQPVFWLDVPGVAAQTLSDGRLVTLGVVTTGLQIEACPLKAE